MYSFTIRERANGSLFFLSLDNATLSFRSLQVLSQANLRVGFRRLILLKGPVGCGKTTLLKLMGGVLPLSEGAVTLAHIDSETTASCYYIHANPEFNFVTGHVADELAFAGLPEEQFSDVLDKSIFEMSGGEMKKFSLQMATASHADVLLVDEPLEMLDDDESASVVSFILREMQTRAFVIATHDTVFDEHADAIIEFTPHNR